MNQEDIKIDLIGYLKQIKSLACLMVESDNTELENLITIEDLCDLAIKKAKRIDID